MQCRPYAALLPAGAVLSLLVAGPTAKAATCADLAQSLAAQNDRIAIARQGRPTCARIYATSEEAYANKTEAEWLALCQSSKETYEAIHEERRQVVVFCAERGSGEQISRNTE